MGLHMTGSTVTQLNNAFARGVSVKDAAFGATGDGAVDDSSAVRAALATGKPVYFPEGTYRVSLEAGKSACLNPASGARIYGPGTLKLAAGQAVGTRIIQTDTVSDVVIDGLTLDMNALSGTGTHAVYATNTTGLKVRNVTIKNSGQGGIMLVAATTGVRITGCDITTDQNGITLYGGVSTGACVIDDVLIHGNRIVTGVQPIDSEPTQGYASNVRITGNYLKTTGVNYAITMSGTDASNRNRMWTVQGNTLIGALWVVQVQDSSITGNLIDASAATTLNAVHGYFSSEDITLTGNRIITATDKTGVALALSSGTRPTGWSITANEVYTSGTAALGIDVSGAGPTVVSSNIVRGQNGSVGIRARSSGVSESVTIVGNDVDGFARGVYGLTTSTFNIERLVITGNSIDNSQGSPTVTAGIALGGTAAQILKCVMAGNVVDPVFTTTHSLGSFVIRDGMGDTSTFSGTGSPEGAVTANIGAHYKRRDGGTSTSLYVKESGTGSTGWVAHGAAPTVSTVVARQTADSSAVNNSVVAVPLADLAVAVDASAKYQLTAFIVYSASTAGDVGLSWSLPSGASIVWSVNASNVTASTANNTIHRGNLSTASVGQCGGIGVGSKMEAMPIGMVTTGGTAGTLQLKFAQVVADATDAVIHADSWIRLDKVA